MEKILTADHILGPYTIVREGKEQPVIICADGEKVCTVPVGDGFIHIKEILSKLKQQGYDGGLVAEMYGHSVNNMYDEIRKSVKWVKETWKGA